MSTFSVDHRCEQNGRDQRESTGIRVYPISATNTRGVENLRLNGSFHEITVGGATTDFLIIFSVCESAQDGYIMAAVKKFEL